MWKDVAKAIRDHQSFVLTTHIHPEGDAIGSEIALAAFLEDLGKEAVIVNSSETPPNSAFLDPGRGIRIYPADFDDAILRGAEAAIITDVNNWSHVGPFADKLKAFDKMRICIDHHQEPEEGFADIVVSDTTAAAAGLLIYELIRFMKGTITPRIAEAVYAAIITDTGTFRFSNTDERVFRAAADLLSAGIRPFKIHRSVFATSRSSVELLGRVLGTLDSTPDGKVAWIHVTREMFEAAGADYEDSDGLIEAVRQIKGVKFCLFFKETSSGRIKVSLRSNGPVDVYEIAKRYGGGGHRMAAGMTVDGPMDEAIRRVIGDCSHVL